MYDDLAHRNFDLLKIFLLTGILHFPCLVIIDVNYGFPFRACERSVHHDCRAIFVEFSEEFAQGHI